MGIPVGRVVSELGEQLGKQLGKKAVKKWAKSGLIPKGTAPQVVDTLTKNIDLSKGADIPEVEVMLKGMKSNNDEAFGAFTDYTRTSQVREHINRKEALLTGFTQKPNQYTRPDAIENLQKSSGQNIEGVPSSQIVSDTSGVAGRGEPFRGHKAKGKEGPKSLIAGTPRNIIKKEPHNIEKAKAWARSAYEYARSGKSNNKSQPLKGFNRYVAEDGTLFKPKPNVGRKGGYQLKFVSLDLLKGYDDLRKLKEAPWRKQEVIDELLAILNRRNEGLKLDKLLKLMVKDYNTKLKGIKAAKQTKGHFISLDKGGLDIAENFGPQKGKSTKNPKTGEWEMGNYAEKADSSIPEGVSVPTTWEEYVDLKLPLLK